MLTVLHCDPAEDDHAMLTPSALVSGLGTGKLRRCEVKHGHLFCL